MINRLFKTANIACSIIFFGFYWTIASASGYVGSTSCAQCHQAIYRQWEQSHHIKAMDKATDNTVLGDFNNQPFNYHHRKTLFFKRDNQFYVTTENAIGKTEIFSIDYVLGFYPLQQYLITFPDGRIQALAVAWDSRKKNEGGQRWFHLYPDDNINSEDLLHWSGTFFNWNSRCANCHTTNYSKNYNFDTDSYNSKWSEINVGCEACHGPAGNHLEWVKKTDNTQTYSGFTKSIKTNDKWQFITDNPIAQNTSHLPTEQIETCAHCHARRSDLVSNITEHNFFNAHQSPLIDNQLYYANGQIREEVYVYDAFKQSKMYAAGVTCSNCHNPHSAQLKLEGNAVCLQCHQSAAYNTPKHHHHDTKATDKSGSQCVNCHAPETTYMQVDPRRDHSFRIPDPDLTLSHHIPNACNQCHTDKNAKWAQQQFKQWNIELKGTVLIEGTTEQLIALAKSNNVATILKASALQQLQERPSQKSFDIAYQNLASSSPEIRLGALRAISFIPVEQRLFLLSYINDPVKAVRMQLADLLAPVPDNFVPPDQLTAFIQLMNEYEEVQRFNADFPETLLSLANFYHQRGRDKEARPYLQRAIKLSPKLSRNHYAFGLWWVRQKDYAQANKYLQKAWQLQPDTIQYSYAYALALDKVGRRNEAIDLLQQTLKRQPNAALLRNALSAFTRPVP